MTERPQFFLRFYEQTDEKIAEFRKKAKAVHPAILASRTLKHPPLSSNLHVRPSHEVVFFFKSERERDAIHANAGLKALYMQYAAPKQADVKFLEKKFGDKVWGHQ